jgi:hypothetical protein
MVYTHFLSMRNIASLGFVEGLIIHQREQKLSIVSEPFKFNACQIHTYASVYQVANSIEILSLFTLAEQGHL